MEKKLINLTQHSYHSMPLGLLNLAGIVEGYQKLSNLDNRFVLTDFHTTGGFLEHSSFQKEQILGVELKVFNDLPLNDLRENIENYSKEEINDRIDLIKNNFHIPDDLKEFVYTTDLENYELIEYLNEVEEINLEDKVFSTLFVYAVSSKDRETLNKIISSYEITPLSALSEYKTLILGISNNFGSLLRNTTEYFLEIYLKRFLSDFKYFLLLNAFNNKDEKKINNLEGYFSKTISLDTYYFNSSEKEVQKILHYNWANGNQFLENKLKEIQSYEFLKKWDTEFIKNYPSEDINSLINNSHEIFNELKKIGDYKNFNLPFNLKDNYFTKERKFLNEEVKSFLSKKDELNPINYNILINSSKPHDEDILEYFGKKDNIFCQNKNKIHQKKLKKVEEVYQDVNNFFSHPSDKFLDEKSLFKKEFLIKTLIYHDKINFSNKIYLNRVKEELNVIMYNGSINLIDYFLLLENFVRQAKLCDNIFNYGRGSAVASLICFGLDLVDCDPIKYKLLFERFLSPERIGYLDLEVPGHSVKDFMKKHKTSI